jgi:hypothetical protein
MKKLTQKEIEALDFKRQCECDHSFNGDTECEYCGLSEDDYSQSCGDGDPIGTYQ